MGLRANSKWRQLILPSFCLSAEKKTLKFSLSFGV